MWSAFDALNRSTSCCSAFPAAPPRPCQKEMVTGAPVNADGPGAGVDSVAPPPPHAAVTVSRESAAAASSRRRTFVSTGVPLGRGGSGHACGEATDEEAVAEQYE